jgi:alpha-methylacyl-CoA racemase
VSGPLAGRTVVELAGIGPAPFAGMLLADMGADVIRVDRPGGADLPAATLQSDLLNRGKRSVVVDLKRPEGVAVLLALAADADVLIEGYRPGVMERLGLGPEVVLARNPRLVYGRMTGWGQHGPLASSAGHDVDYIAVTGALHAIGAAGGPPQIPLNLLGDFGGGSTYLVMGVLAALLEAGTGRGQVVDAAIVDGTAHLLALTHTMLNSGRWADERGANLLDGGTPFYAVYATSDGGHMAVGALEPRFFAELVRLLDLPPGVLEPATQHDPASWPAMRRTLAETFARRTRAEWTEVFAGTDACVAPVVALREAAAHPHIAARGTVTDTDGVLQPGVAPRFSHHPTAAPGRSPALGAHTREVLDKLALDTDRLLADGVAVQA